MAGPEVHIDVARQQLHLMLDGAILRTYPVSTALNGVGEHNGSGWTPPGLAAAPPGRDWILSRILWLTGCEPGVNRGGAVDTLRRFIYLHGCPDGLPMGVPASHGCVRMTNADVIDLFDRVAVGARVCIHSTQTPRLMEGAAP